MCESKPHLKISFAMIDGKDTGVLRVNQFIENLHNGRIADKAKFEYLQGIVELQDKIKKKYEPMFVANEENPDDDLSSATWFDRNNKEQNWYSARLEGVIRDIIYDENRENGIIPTKEMESVYYT